MWLEYTYKLILIIIYTIILKIIIIGIILYCTITHCFLFIYFLLHVLSTITIVIEMSLLLIDRPSSRFCRAMIGGTFRLQSYSDTVQYYTYVLYIKQAAYLRYVGMRLSIHLVYDGQVYE